MCFSEEKGEGMGVGGEEKLGEGIRKRGGGGAAIRLGKS